MVLGRKLMLVLGLMLVGIGFVGVFVPGMPTTVFMIMALFCFKKSSVKLENWLLNHRCFGATLREWERDRTIRPRTKLIAIVSMWSFIAVSLFFIKSPWIAAIVILLGAAGTTYIATRRSNVSAAGQTTIV